MFSFRLDEFFLLIALQIYLQRALGVSSQPHFWCILKVHLCSAWGSGADNSKLLLPGDGECALQPGPKICPCFIAWVCVQGNSRCVPIQLRHSSCSEDENVGIVSWTPSFSSPWICLRALKQILHSPCCLPCVWSDGKVHSALRLQQTTKALVGCKTWKLLQWNHISSHPEICSADRKFPGIIPSSVWCLPGRLCAQSLWDRAAVTLSVTGRFPCVLYKHLTQGTLCSQPNCMVMQVNRSSCGWGLKHLALLFCVPDSFIAVNTPRSQFNKLSTIKRFFFMVLRGLICNSWLHSLWKL